MSEARPLVLLRALVTLASLVWLALGAPGSEHPRLVAAILAVFSAYGAGLLALLWVRPDRVVRWHLAVLCVDLACALTVIRLTGGARSAFFLALYLVAALQAYHYGTRRGIVVAAAVPLLYVATVWTTLDAVAAADYVLRVGLLFVTAAGLGVLGRRERAERQAVLALNAALDARNRFVRDMLGSLRDGVVVLDGGGRITDWNRAMEMSTGLAAPAVLGRPLADVFSAPTGASLAAAVASIRAGRDTGARREWLRYRTPAGRDVVLDLKGNAIRDTDGTLRGVILVVEDVSERIALEESLRQADRLAGIGTLAAGVAHEINNPIGVITSRTELMIEAADREGLGPRAREDLEVIQAHAHRVGRITESLLSFARRRPAERAVVDLNRVVEDTLLKIGPQAEAAGVRLRAELAPGQPLVAGDAALLGQALRNLVDNAREALGSGGEIMVRTEADAGVAGDVRLVVRDNGAGIPDTVAPRIFEPFFTTKPAATGLGLAVCYGIVREHDGVIRVESRPGEGTAVVLSLPGWGPQEGGRGP